MAVHDEDKPEDSVDRSSEVRKSRAQYKRVARQKAALLEIDAQLALAEVQALQEWPRIRKMLVCGAIKLEVPEARLDEVIHESILDLREEAGHLDVEAFGGEREFIKKLLVVMPRVSACIRKKAQRWPSSLTEEMYEHKAHPGDNPEEAYVKVQTAERTVRFLELLRARIAESRCALVVLDAILARKDSTAAGRAANFPDAEIEAERERLKREGRKLRQERRMRSLEEDEEVEKENA